MKLTDYQRRHQENWEEGLDRTMARSGRSQDFEMGEQPWILSKQWPQSDNIFEIGLKWCKFRALKSISLNQWPQSGRNFLDCLKMVQIYSILDLKGVWGHGLSSQAPTWCRTYMETNWCILKQFWDLLGEESKQLLVWGGGLNIPMSSPGYGPALSSSSFFFGGSLPKNLS